jgi:phytoene dehydrogenase-like protein
LDIACRLKSYETIVLETADLRAISSGFTTGEMKSFFISVPSLVDPTACPRGKHVVTLSALVAHALGETWADQKQTFANRLVKKAENVIPGLAESFEILAVASPATLNRYTLNTKGALVGWENTPAQVGPHRPGPRTSIQGLYIAGHWSRPSGGVYGVMASGCYAVQSILGYKTLAKLFKALC